MIADQISHALISTQERLDVWQGCENCGYRKTTSDPGHANSSVYVRTWPSGDQDKELLQASHSRSIVQWHLVHATWNRDGTFSRRAAAAVVDKWEELNDELGFLFRKVSFLPDHVRLALRTCPAVVPAKLVLMFLHSSPELMKDRFADLLIRTGNPRVWKPSAYVGTYGELATAHVQAHLRNCWNGNVSRRAPA